MDDVQWPIGPIQQYRTFNQGPSISVFFNGLWLANYNRHVALMDLSCFKSLANSALRFNTTRHDEQAGRILVKPMHHQRIWVDRLNALGQTILFVRSPAWNRQQTTGFVENEHMLVEIHRGHASEKLICF